MSIRLKKNQKGNRQVGGQGRDEASETILSISFTARVDTTNEGGTDYTNAAPRLPIPRWTAWSGLGMWQAGL